MDASPARSTSELRLRGGAAALAAVMAMGTASATFTAAPVSAWASSGDDSRATELKSRGDADMDSGAYADAITSYRASYERRRDPALLYDIGTAYERLGDYPNALAYLEEFALAAPPDLRARVPALERIIAGVRASVARLRIACDVAGARIMVRGVWRGTTPLRDDIVLAPGPARVELFADGHRPFVHDVGLIAGRETTVRVALVDDDRVSTSAPPSHGDTPGSIVNRWWFWTGVGAVVLGGMAVAVALAQNHSQASGDMPAEQPSMPFVRW